ncbi:hypothetical protein GCM10007049_17190 [Echinicola pacifica]|uniref:DUF1735 domain-containing protein n=1 Tax=Echinicola pacifica TaxID=346377 RepID=A0A918PWG0_9BACT|nr:DUF1735 domain-containing protein [Echinicola pacifica]GGZ25257.1 hypothetical protein GCM10007049_17190 [Echinicola pacifica]
MKKIAIVVLLALGITGCYDDDFLNPKLDKTLAYFASFENHTRTVVVGEGLRFKIGAAMAGVLNNNEDRTIDFQLYQTDVTFTDIDDTRELLPIDYYGTSEMNNGLLQATIPSGEYLGYFSVEMDSINFLNDPKALEEIYTLPVKIVGTSLDSIGIDSVNVTVKYMSAVDGYYLYQSEIRKEIDGEILDDKTVVEKYNSEGDENAWRLTTIGPFEVQATSATTAFTNGLMFNMTVQGGEIAVDPIDGQPVVMLEDTNTYDSSTRDFNLNFHYQLDDNDTVYHVSTDLIFRNRVRDGVNETRDYLSYFNQ